jgi:UDP:flavonoid glycosyltransferase YjiC (YdhE family)
MTTRCAVVIPAYNEGATIREIVTRTMAQVPWVIVVDDGSEDDTAAALRGLPVALLRNPHNLGKGTSLLRGMQRALDDGATAVITLDGDGQHEPEDLPSLIAMHRDNPGAIVVGSRLHEKDKIPRPRYYANRTASFWISWAAGQAISDSQSGFRLYPADVLRSIGLTSDRAQGFVFESEMLIEAGRKHIKVLPVAISAIYGRHLRRSHFRQVTDVALIIRMVAWKLLSRGLYLSGLIRSLRRPAVITRPQRPCISLASTGPVRKRSRLLFMAESVTLAHVARPLTLAKMLDPSRYEVHFACDPRYMSLLGDLPFPVHSISSISSERFRTALDHGDPLYDVSTLRAYVNDDLELISALAPETIIGDFRLSLSISARLAGVPYATITNAHWSPYAKQRFLVPELPLTRAVGRRVGQFVFDMLRPFIFVQQAFALNRVRREYGLASVAYSLPGIFTDADETLYADLPELVPTYDCPPSHRYLGPLLWSPKRFPSWWATLPKHHPTAYVNLGTSGRSDLLPIAVRAASGIGMQVLAATAGRVQLPRAYTSVWSADYLPGSDAAERSELVICNGGSASVYQALAAGVPVLGIPTNLDQFMMMSYVCEAGVGVMIPAGQATVESIRSGVRRILHSSRYRRRAEGLKHRIRTDWTAERFENALSNSRMTA